MRRLRLNARASAGFVALATALAACQRTEDGQVQVQVPDVDVKVGRDTVTLKAPDVPNVDVGTKRDTVAVQRPTVDVKRP